MASRLHTAILGVYGRLRGLLLLAFVAIPEVYKMLYLRLPTEFNGLSMPGDEILAESSEATQRMINKQFERTGSFPRLRKACVQQKERGERIIQQGAI